MNTKSRTRPKKVIASVFLTGLLVLVSRNAAEARVPDTGGACQRISRVEATVLERLEKRSEALRVKREARNAARGEERRKEDTRVAELRSREDEARLKQYEAVKSRMTSDTHKAAFEKFTQEANAAIRVRREAVDQSRKTYRESIDALVSKQTNVISQTMTALTDTITEAFAKADAGCGDKDYAEARSALRKEVRNAQDAFRDARSLLLVSQNEYAQIRQTRENAIRAAYNTFRETLTKSREGLERVL